VIGEASWLVLAGIGLGMIGAGTAATLMRHLFFEVDSWDPAILGTAAGLLIVSALLASYVPARRAASVNPVEVLRAE
jgi:macrolide transport system ATP-binding/permease protein